MTSFWIFFLCFIFAILLVFICCKYGQKKGTRKNNSNNIAWINGSGSFGWDSSHHDGWGHGGHCGGDGGGDCGVGDSGGGDCGGGDGGGDGGGGDCGGGDGGGDGGGGGGD